MREKNKQREEAKERKAKAKKPGFVASQRQVHPDKTTRRSSRVPGGTRTAPGTAASTASACCSERDGLLLDLGLTAMLMDGLCTELNKSHLRSKAWWYNVTEWYKGMNRMQGNLNYMY